MPNRSDEDEELRLRDTFAHDIIAHGVQSRKRLSTLATFAHTEPAALARFIATFDEPTRSQLTTIVRRLDEERETSNASR